MIKGIIFDLDMCILDTRSLTGLFFQPILDVLHSSKLPQKLKKKINNILWSTSLDDKVDFSDIPEKVAEDMREAYQKIEIPNEIKSFGDEEYIRNLPGKKILVTSGYKKFQETKIAKLGIADLFDEIIIDALDFHKLRKNKTKIFEEILVKNHWHKEEVLVVGDNPKSELGAAKSLGVATVQTLRPTVEKWKEADYHVISLEELKNIISKHNNDYKSKSFS